MDSGVVASSKGRILIVDDEPELGRSWGRHLTAAGFSVDVVFDGLEAQAFLADNQVDAIVSDIAMPGLDGISLLNHIREHDLSVPVVLVTGTPSIETAARAVELGAARYLFKPVDPVELLKNVAAAVRLRQLGMLKQEALRLLAAGGQGIGELAALMSAFDRALGSLWMAFQPIVSCRGRTVYAYEALVRTKEPSLPHPGALFDAAERLGRVPELGIIIREAAAEAFASAPDDIKLFVNLHMLDLNELNLYLPTSALARIGRRVVLEITERSSVDEVKNLRARATALRSLGFRLAIDDLGAGYAGLTSFALLEPEVVKLDMSLVRDIHREPVKQRIVRSMISLCAESGILVIAEGIETREERDELLRLGCEYMQGYLFARPALPFPEVAWD